MVMPIPDTANPAKRITNEGGDPNGPQVVKFPHSKLVYTKYSLLCILCGIRKYSVIFTVK